ncbi:MAG TPA: hypothetical protein VN944_00835 [Nitrospiria bacterium]|nr:hypothetical protein [Nitrospiria bacterium]
MPDKPLYTVIEGNNFSQQLPLFIESIKKWDEIKSSIDLDLARNPFLARKIPNTELYVLTLRTNPPLTIYFSIERDKQEITLLEIKQF